jgi:hypothetical protein
LVGLSAQCQPQGTKDVGGACTTSADCFAGLACSAAKCEPLPPAGDGSVPLLALPPIWAGETCTDDPGPTKAYFRVPRGSNDGDFYRLPFPNDVRLDGGKISLKNHPTPGPALLGYDVIQRWFDDLTATADGFSAYPTVLFRFNTGVDLGGTFKSKGSFRWVDVTMPTAPVDLGFGWSGTTARNQYICDNWIGVRPQFGVPLKPGHTYAVMIMNSALDTMGKTIQSSPDFTALVAATMPSDPVLAQQWPKYQPLRDWAAGANVPVASIVTAAVFTVGHPGTIASKLPAAIAAAAPPTVTNWVRCGDAPSPCPQATGVRGCGMTDALFDELQAMVTLPIFQQGTEPYWTQAEGGGFALASDGTPQVQRTEQVCMDLTVPKGVTMPAGGWPLVVYAHGTGGSFRSHVTEGVAHRLASVDDGSGGHVNIAVLGIDQVETGTRRGNAPESQDSPDNLFYNFSNPLAARGNPLQGAADQLSLVRLVTGFDLPGAQSPTGTEIKVGPIAFWGHSQGATQGAIAMPYAVGVTGAVLSGEGASLVDALLHKTNPVNIASVVPVVLEDPSVDAFHPVLSLLQNDLDGDDPLNYAASLVTTPIAAANQKHLFQPYGQGDTFAPPVTEQTFAIAAQLGQVAAPSGVTPEAFGGAPLPPPAGGNAIVQGKTLTAIVRQYAPDTSYDGHFVAFDNMQAETDVDHFLADALSGKVPQVGR